MEHIMIDLETLDTSPSAAIISLIGAVKFRSATQTPLGDKFYLPVSIQSNLDEGRTISGDTLRWWMNQDDGAQRIP